MSDQRTTAVNGFIETIKATPPVAVTAATLSGITISEIAIWITAFYTLLLIILTIRDRIIEPWAKRKRHNKICAKCENEIKS